MCYGIAMAKAILTPRVFELRAQGWSLRRIGREFGVSQVAVTHFLQRYSGPERVRPSGPCDICGDNTKELDSDHNHATGRARGMLCRPCNQGIGFFRDDIARLTNAIAYINRYST